MNQMLIFAHNHFPITIKFMARGAISGSIAGFILSFVYSMIFGLPYIFILFILFLAEISTKGVGAIVDGLQAVLFVFSSLFVQCVLPAIAVGILGGALTGLGTRFLKGIIKNSPFRAILFSTFLWTILILIVVNSSLPRMLLKVNHNDGFMLWVLILIPSAIFVGAMACIAKISMFPFFSVAVEPS